MAVVAGQTFNIGTDGTAPIDTILTQEANRIGPDIHRRTVHTSPWLDLIKQTAFPAGMGYTLGTLIYDRALPTQTAGGTALGVNWTPMAPAASNATALETGSSTDQLIPGAFDQNIGANLAAGKSFINFTRQLKQYSLKRAVVESPRINVEDLRFAAYRQEQLRAVMDALTDATRYSWEERNRAEYDRLCGNFVLCKTASTTVTTGANEELQTWAAAGAASSTSKLGDVDVTADDGTADINANISNKILDSIYFRLVRGGAGNQAYGRENSRPVFALICSSEASYQLVTESGFRDDYRYNNAKVGELIAPLGVERSHRGFYHLVDDLAPRYSFNATTDALERVEPYVRGASNAVIVPNPAYETASFEAAYVLHQDVMESQIPEPITGANGLTFDPVTYRGKFDWKNIPNELTNPDGTIGFFRGVLASGSKPIRTEFGYAIIFKRDTSALAA
jgi:hypothetical protein